MKYSRSIAVICALAICGFASEGRAWDQLDEQIALLEKENATLKKSIRLDALKKENADLQRQLDIAPPSQSKQQRSVITPDRQIVSADGSNSYASVRTTAEAKARLLESEAYYPQPDQFTSRWAGAYVGGHVGMGFGRWPTEIGNSRSCTGGCFPADYSLAANNTTNSNTIGALAGGQVGYLWQVDRFVFGPEFDISASTLGSKRLETVTVAGFGQLQSSPSNNEAALTWLSTLRGRVGIAAGDWLFFGTGGLAVAGLNFQTNAGYPSISGSAVTVGYAAGGGLQYAVGPHASLRAEYLYYGLPGKTVHGQDGNSAGGQIFSQTATMSVKPSTNVVRAGVDWRFN